MCENNNPLARHRDNGDNSDQTVDSEDETFAGGNYVQPTALSSALNDNNSLPDTLVSNNVQMENCEGAMIGCNNYYQNVNVTIISDATNANSVQDNFRSNDTFKSDIELERPFEYFSRAEWLAMPPSKPPIALQLPANKLIIAHTETRNVSNSVITFVWKVERNIFLILEYAFDLQEASLATVRSFQRYHVDTRRLDDISYNFLVDGCGNVYEGRGWNRQGKHTLRYNERSICIAFIGNFTDVKPPEWQLIAAQKLIAECIKLKKLAADYRLFGHLQLQDTDSPGRELYKIIAKWPHWSEDIF